MLSTVSWPLLFTIGSAVQIVVFLYVMHGFSLVLSRSSLSGVQQLDSDVWFSLYLSCLRLTEFLESVNLSSTKFWLLFLQFFCLILFLLGHLVTLSYVSLRLLKFINF